MTATAGEEMSRKGERGIGEDGRVFWFGGWRRKGEKEKRGWSTFFFFFWPPSSKKARLDEKEKRRAEEERGCSFLFLFHLFLFLSRAR